MHNHNTDPKRAANTLSQCLLGALLVLTLAEEATSDDAAPNIADISINELMQMEVSSASRKSESLSDTTAAAFIISQDDIRRSGATSIPEALRLAPGIEVAQINANSWAITSRGFNGRYANKLLVLMDGRSVYTPLFSGVFWNLQDTLMEDIERIEVIRGPGAVMWGANAVNGVINIITKKAKDTQGDLFVAGGGNQEQGFAGYRHGGQIGNDGNYRVYAKTFERAAFVNPNGQRQHDDWRSVQGGFRIDDRISSQHRFTVQGDVYRKKVGNTVPPVTVSGPFSSAFNVDDLADGANLISRWEGSLSDGSEFVLQGYYDRVDFTAPALSDSQDMFDIDFQHRLHPDPSHDLMWGINYRFIHSSTVNSSAIAFTPNSLGYHQGGAFVQDDITLIDHTLRLTLGSKIEESHFGHTQVQPNARLLWTPNGTHSVWASVSRASRIPSRGEAQSSIAVGTASASIPPIPFSIPVQVMALPNPNLKAEKVFSAEIGYRTQWNERFSTDITAFSNHYTDLIVLSRGNASLQTTPALLVNQPMMWTNLTREITTRGVEVSADWNPLDWMRFTGNYSYLKIEKPYDPNNPDIAGLSPRQRGMLRWQIDMTPQTHLDVTLRHVGRLHAVNQNVPAYTTFDARFAYEPIAGMEWSVVAQNIFAPQHLEFRDTAAVSLTDITTEVPRSIYGKFSWSF
ncbi:TonB-dependent receptor plug domain-containing protein [Methylomonas methanica]|uniref:TonB-dependent receptor n=1 Tax=Methylomonas methanica (strain DSM 25384 / MC09) TaxID=857087 RepID=F9ZWT2_METMM|nr:TonB-dependent receptor [Methylomonas methanica]AEG02094.1 TonB-dependent receptor [Methylomonas methanica MC09]